MAVISMQRGSARRIVAIALLALIPLVFCVLAVFVPRDAQNDAAPAPAAEATLTLLGRLPMKPSSERPPVPPGTRFDRAGHGSR
jgi:hypothetical protein